MPDNTPKNEQEPRSWQLKETLKKSPTSFEYSVWLEKTLFYRSWSRTWDTARMSPAQRLSVKLLFALGFAIVFGAIYFILQLRN
jgi:hypothetical protein